MFEKLLANLPYNPDVTRHLRFYARRLHHEEAVRTIGFVFIVLAFAVQALAIISPPHLSRHLPGVSLDGHADASTPCQSSTFACITQTAAVSNQTQSIDSANGTTAQPNDVLVYTFSATNSGTA